jgi:hypothetical protein
VRVGEVSMERTAKAGYAVFGFLRRAKVALGGAEDRSPRKNAARGVKRWRLGVY